MQDFLQVIKKRTLDRANQTAGSLAALRMAAEEARKPCSFLDIFKENVRPACIIAEIKFSSPSTGKIFSSNDPVSIAKEYIENGASALSILTEPDYFKGSLEYLKQVRNAFPKIKLLMKDFVLNESQLLQARIYGADAVLLIAAFLSFSQLQKLYNYAIDLGLTPLIEVHTLHELKAIEPLNPKLIGINNRNLETLQLNLSVSHQLREHVATNSFLISESGIKTGTDIKKLQQLGYQGFLVGSHFMRSVSPGAALKKMLNEVSDAC